MRVVLDDTPFLQMQLSPTASRTQSEGRTSHYDGELVVYDFTIRLEEHGSVEEDVPVYLNFSNMENLVLVGAEPLPFCRQPTSDTTF